MHIEPGVVDGAKILLSIGTAAAAIGLGAKMVWTSVREDGGIAALGLRSVAATIAVFGFFEVLPHYPVGVSEVHLILGSTLFLLLGAGPAAIGLALGLLAQSLLIDAARRRRRCDRLLPLHLFEDSGFRGWGF